MQSARLQESLESIGIEMQTDLIRLGATNGGLGVFAVRDVQKGQVLCTIPKSAVLSIRNSKVADLLEEQRIRGGLGLIITILYEISVQDSRWWAFTQQY